MDAQGSPDAQRPAPWRRPIQGIGAAAIRAHPAGDRRIGTGWRAGGADHDRAPGFLCRGRHRGRDPATSSISRDHGFVEYQIPGRARKTALMMWHSSSVALWQNRWDGGEGFQSIFLRRGYPVYLWDGPRVGRANWGCSS